MRSFYKVTAIFICLLLIGCNELIEFEIANEKKGIVIEAEISNKSFTDTYNYPSLGRYFYVRLAYLSDVTNIKDDAITNAKVTLHADDGQTWDYTEDSPAGYYYLYDEDFAAEYGKNYRLEINTSDGTKIWSDWQTMPEEQTQIGSFSVEEVDYQQYKFQSQDERVLKTFKGIYVKTKIDGRSVEKPRYYRWTFSPTYIYDAPMTNLDSPVRRCWVHDSIVLKRFSLEEEKNASYDHTLFRLQTAKNDKVFIDFSTLVKQTSVSEAYYNFWQGIRGQEDSGGLFDRLRYTIETNYTAEDENISVNGFFGVVTENGKRWQFESLPLSYPITNTTAQTCADNFNPRKIPSDPCPCRICLDYSNSSTNVKPHWY